jgi:hypothetical protein
MLNSKRYTDIIIHKAHKSVFLSQSISLQNVTILNAAESKITSITALTDFDFDATPNTNASNPTVTYEPYYEDVGTLTITILKTSDNSIPSKVQLGIFGCANPITVVTKAQIEPTITSGKIFSCKN